MWLVTRQQTNLVQSANALRQDAEALLRVKQAHTLRLQYDQTAADKVRCLMLQQPSRCFQLQCADMLLRASIWLFSASVCTLQQTSAHSNRHRHCPGGCSICTLQTSSSRTYSRLNTSQ